MAKQTLEGFADQRDIEVHAENQAIARKNRVLHGELTTLADRVAGSEAENAALEKELGLYQRKYNDRPKWLAPAKKTVENHGTLLAFLSDTHYGETIGLAEMGGYNKYNLAIAEMRTREFFERTVRLARDYFAGVKYDGIVLAIGGDLVSGDIHDELQQSNEKSTLDTTVWAIPRLYAGIEMWRKEFGAVHVVSAPGNHGRDDKVPRYKGRSAHNADSHIVKIVAMQFEGSGDVTFEIPESLDSTFSIGQWNFGLEHGDELSKNFSGSAEIGWLGPLIRGTNRKVNAYAAEGKRLDYCLWGHGHQLIPVPSRGVIGNGSICGYNEFARGRKFRPEPPLQSLMLVDPVHGVTIPAPVRVQNRTAEGW